MAKKQRPSVLKREREFQKREREKKKSQKAALKRERRLKRRELEPGAPADEEQPQGDASADTSGELTPDTTDERKND
jgi:hypothetical protein